MPLTLVELVEYLPSKVYSRIRKTRKIIDRVSGGLVDRAIEEARSVELEKGKKVVMSVLGLLSLVVHNLFTYSQYL